MSDHQALNATFFTLKSRQRMVLLPATLITLVLIALILALFAWLNWGTLTSFGELFHAAAEQKQPSEEQAARLGLGILGLFGWGFLLLFPLYLVVAAYEAACLRWMIRGEAPGLFGITINADTWRVYGVYWVWFFAQMVVSTALSFVVIPFAFMGMGDVMSNPQPDPAEMMALQLRIQLPLALLQYAVMIFIGVRLSPAAATSVARMKFSFFEAWTVTRGRFWALFGAWALLWLIFLVLYVTASGFMIAAVFWQIMPHTLESYENPTPEMLQALSTAFMTPSTWWTIGLGYAALGLSAFAYALFAYGVNARAALAALDEGKIEREAAA